MDWTSADVAMMWVGRLAVGAGGLLLIMWVAEQWEMRREDLRARRQANCDHDWQEYNRYETDYYTDPHREYEVVEYRCAKCGAWKREEEEPQREAHDGEAD